MNQQFRSISYFIRFMFRTCVSGALRPLGCCAGFGLTAFRPVPRYQFFDAVLRPSVDQMCQQVSKIGLWIDVVQLAGLCRPPNYAERFADDAWLSRCFRLSRGRWLRIIRHRLVGQSASRKASNRSLGRGCDRVGTDVPLAHEPLNDCALGRSSLRAATATRVGDHGPRTKAMAGRERQCGRTVS
jgi:hypothetical protein